MNNYTPASLEAISRIRDGDSRLFIISAPCHARGSTIEALCHDICKTLVPTTKRIFVLMPSCREADHMKLRFLACAPSEGSSSFENVVRIMVGEHPLCIHCIGDTGGLRTSRVNDDDVVMVCSPERIPTGRLFNTLIAIDEVLRHRLILVHSTTNERYSRALHSFPRHMHACLIELTTKDDCEK